MTIEIGRKINKAAFDQLIPSEQQLVVLRKLIDAYTVIAERAAWNFAKRFGVDMV